MVQANKLPRGIHARGGCLEIDFRYKGKRIRKAIGLAPTPKDIKYAVETRASIIRDIKLHGKFDFSEYFPGHKLPSALNDAVNMMCISAAMDWWLKEFMNKSDEARSGDDQKSDKTIKSHKSHIELHIKPKLGKIAINKLEHTHIHQFLDSLPMKNKSKINVISTLKMMYKHAIRNGLITHDPFIKVESLSIDKTLPNPLSTDEIDKLLNNCPDEYLQAVFQFALWTGLRSGEQVALEWSDFDESARTLNITKSSNESGLAPIKNNYSLRHIDLLPPAYEALLKAKKINPNSKWIFPIPNSDNMWSSKSIGEYWSKNLKKLDIPHRSFYKTRHTFISLMISAGMPTFWLKTQTGHSRSEMIDTTYGKWISVNGRTKTVLDWVKEKCPSDQLSPEIRQFIYRQ